VTRTKNYCTHACIHRSIATLRSRGDHRWSGLSAAVAVDHGLVVAAAAAHPEEERQLIVLLPEDAGSSRPSSMAELDRATFCSIFPAGCQGPLEVLRFGSTDGPDGARVS
jgi:hypothetical protein